MNLLFNVGQVLAATPAYVMDTTVTSSVTDLLSSMVQTIFTIIPVAIGLVGALVVTLFGIRWLIGFARGHMHG
jgi:undecaprenyl pyrophosphate phosphatase UppP